MENVHQLRSTHRLASCSMRIRHAPSPAASSESLESTCSPRSRSATWSASGESRCQTRQAMGDFPRLAQYAPCAVPVYRGSPSHYVSRALLILSRTQPQIIETWQSKIVGSLSIPMMLIQTPGSALFVYSLIIRPGVNWTAWAVYMISESLASRYLRVRLICLATAGILQGILLVICIAFTIRLR